MASGPLHAARPRTKFLDALRSGEPPACTAPTAPSSRPATSPSSKKPPTAPCALPAASTPPICGAKSCASLLDTGQPWLGFKDAVNTRSAQDHSGLVCAAALGGALLLNADPGEAAACPFGAVNIAAHLTERPAGLDVALLRGTITAAVRMLDNAVDLSAYPSARVRAASLQHRPIGLGVAGFAEALDRLQHHPASPAAADFADWSMELVSYFAILASAELAAERGPYPGYAGSKWSRGILPIDTLALLSNAAAFPSM